MSCRVWCYMVKPWPRLPREVVDAPSLETFQPRLDRALSTLIQVRMSLLTVGGLGSMASKGPFQPKPFYSLSNDGMRSMEVLAVLDTDV